MQGSGCRVYGFGFMKQGLDVKVYAAGVTIQGSGFGGSPGISSRIQGSWCRIHGFGFRVQDPGYRVHGLTEQFQSDSGFMVQGAGFMVLGLGFKIQG